MFKCVIRTTNYDRFKMFLGILQNYKIPALCEINSAGWETITYFCDKIPETLFNATEIIPEEN